MSTPTIRVLYIDDEEENLKTFRANFRRLYEIYTVTSAMEGLKILKNIDIHIIMADQKMPNMTGVEFFRMIAQRFPDPTRILVTGFTDIEALADAINHGHIFRYTTKPWVDLELHNTLVNAYDAYKAKINLRTKVEELEKTNNELNRFIYSISHELRAPLVSVMGIVNLVKLEGLFHSSGEYWGLIETCSNKLDYYIQKTLEYYKNNKNITENSKIDFNSLLKNLVELYQYTDKETQITTHVTQEHDFYGDIFRLEVVLGNLISNAIQFQKTEEKNKHVNIYIIVDKDQAIITVKDNGLGILQEHIDKIFNQFFKGKSQFGTGLGLFIVKEALLKINGKIAVSSKLNEGTTFKITIPNGK